MTSAEIYSANLRIFMAAKNITATELAKRAGISRNSVNLARKEHRKMIKFSTIDSIAKALKIPVYRFFQVPKAYLIKEERHVE